MLTSFFWLDGDHGGSCFCGAAAVLGFWVLGLGATISTHNKLLGGTCGKLKNFLMLPVEMPIHKYF